MSLYTFAVRTPDGRALLLGRAQALATVHECLDRARGGLGAVLVVSGEAGIGKSRLLRQAAGEASGFAVHVGTADEMTQTRPFSPWLEALQITVSARDEGRRSVAVLLRAAMLASAGELGSATHVVIEDLVDLVERLADEMPRMIVIEDLQWADEETVLTARAVARSAAHLPLVLVMSYRSGALSPIAQRLCREVLGMDGACELPLAELDHATARRLAQQLAGEAVWPSLNDQVAAAGGNPMLIELLVSANGRSSESDLRLAVREHVRKRAWVLGDEVVDTLNYAALLGRRFSPELLAEVLGRRPVEVAAALQRGVEQRLLVPSGNELAFRHDLIRDALSDELPHALRASMHTAIGRALARTGARSAEVARHVALGAPRGDQEALELLRRAAVEYRRLAPAVTVDLLTRAENLAEERLPDQVELELLWALAATGRTGTRTQRAQRMLQEGLDPATEAAVHACLGLIQQRAGDLESARTQFDTAVTFAAEAGGVRAAYLADAASTRALMGDFAGARSVATEALLSAQSAADDGARCEALCALTWAAHCSGDVVAAVAHAREAVTVEDDGNAGLDGGNPLSRLGLGLALLDGGAVDDAEKVLREGRSRADRAGSAAQLPWFQWALALCAYVRGAWQDASAEAESGLVEAADGTNIARQRLQVLVSRLESHSAAPEAPESDPVTTWHSAAPDRWMISWSFLLPAAVRSCKGLSEDPDVVMQSLHAGDLSALGPLGVAVARWCRALVIDDGQQVLEVARELASTNRAGLASAAFEDAGDALARKGSHTQAGDAYSTALELFASAGAAADVARVTRSRQRIALTPADRPGRPTSGWASLTPSEVLVARHVAAGLRNRDIAAQLFISRHTVESHLKHIFAKLDVQSRVELALLAPRHLEA
jgi:DNA-binding CsgD family transcriptional regulator